MQLAMHKRPEYLLLSNMIARCHNPKNPRYADYGGRGIVVCDEWRSRRAAVVAWAQANGYEKGLHIDRIDNDGPYSPDNCRFVTPKLNASNRRNTRYLTAFGETKTMGQWLADSRCNARTEACLHTRLIRGMSDYDAIVKPYVTKERTQGVCVICGVVFIKSHTSCVTCSRSCGNALGHRRRRRDA